MRKLCYFKNLIFNEVFNTNTLKKAEYTVLNSYKLLL